MELPLLLSLVLAAVVISPTKAKINVKESRIIDECLKSYGGLSEEKAQRLIRFKDWSREYEEIPCFTKCYIKNMLDIFDESVGFKEAQVIRVFGQELYKACQHRMVPLPNSCEQAYHGFHCIVNHENDPFILVESMQNISTVAKTVMKSCLQRISQNQLEHFEEYAKRPVREPIRCFTKCFIDQLHVYNAKARQWNISVLRTELGVPKLGASIEHCMARRPQRDSCVWMYQAFTCFSLAN